MLEYIHASTLEEVEAYLYNIPKFTKKNSLENTKKFIKYLNISNIQDKVIHVAGTNGKGSDA